MNRYRWAAGFCSVMGWPLTIVPGLVAVMVGESSGARCNPLDDELVVPGSTNYNPQGVQNYPSVRAGWWACSRSLRGFYPGVIAAGAAGDPMGFVGAWGRSPWGTWSSSIEGGAELQRVYLQPSLGFVLVAGTEEEDMGDIYRRVDNGAEYFEFSPGRLTHVADPATTASLQAAGHSLVQVDAATAVAAGMT